MKTGHHLAVARAPAVGPAKILLVVAMTLALAACKHDDDPTRVAGWALVDPVQRHPITVSQQPQTMQLRVLSGSQGLSPAQRADLMQFADRSRASDAGNSRLVISVPSGSANEIAAMNAVGEIRRLLADNGFAESSIAVEAYHNEGGQTPPIRVSYLRYVATAPDCGNWPTNLARQYDNLSYANFGCATQRNFAAQIANPADLLGPRTEGERSSDRRDVVFDKYVRGRHTGADKPIDRADRTEVGTDASK